MKLTFVGRERRTAKIAAYQDVLYWLQKYPFDQVTERIIEKQAQWHRELNEDEGKKASNT